MPKKRHKINEGLPSGWRFKNGAYYYQVPKKYKNLCANKSLVRLGKTKKESDSRFRHIYSNLLLGNNMYEEVTLTSHERKLPWKLIKIYNEDCDITIATLAGIYRSARFSAKVKNLEFTITPFELVEIANSSNGKCMLTGIKWSIYEQGGKAGKRVWAPSLDRIDSNKGYTKNNCRLVCCAVNIALSDLGDNVLIKIAQGLHTMGKL